MARIEDFLDEARVEARELLVDVVGRDDAATVVEGRKGVGQGPKQTAEGRARFEDSVTLGLTPAMRGARAALQASTAGRGDSGPPLPEALRLLGSSVEKSAARGAEPNPRLERIGACFTAVADLVVDRSAEEKRRVHDHVATTTAHLSRVCAATQTREGSGHVQKRENLTELARDLDSRRTTHAPHDLGERGLVGVPATPFEQSLSHWHALSQDALTGQQLAAGAASAPEVAGTAALISAAAYRACLTQDSPAARDRAEHWKSQAVAWREARSAWRPPPVLVAGDHRPQPELAAAGRDLREHVEGEFRDANRVWVPPERLADPEALRRFEYDARAVMTDLGAKYNSAVASVAISEVIAIPVAQQSGLDEIALESMRGPRGRREWVMLSATDDAAKRLSDTAGQVEAAALKLNRPGPASFTGPVGAQQQGVERDPTAIARAAGQHRGGDKDRGRA